MMAVWWFLSTAVAAAPPPPPPPPPPPVPAAPVMDNTVLHAFVVRLLGDAEATEARRSPNVWEFQIEGYPVMVITDAAADRMRIMVPAASVLDLPPGAEGRMLQANFDAVLDARYAIAQGLVWSVFIHPLSPLTEGELGSGLAQVVTAAATFGTSYTSGALVFGGGDTARMQQELYQRILDRLELLEQGI